MDVSNTRGAGPGPVEGVSGPGSTAVVPGSEGHERPPEGNFSQQLGWFLWALRMHESNGDYQANAGTSASTACGAYQYIGSTWNNYEGYATACDAPPPIQDKRAKRDIIAKWNQFGKWQQVAAQHFTGSWGNQPERWNDCPAACDFNPTVWEYVDGVIGKMRSAAAARPPSGNMQPASFRTGDGGATILPADVPGAAPADVPGAAPGGDAEAPPTASNANTGSSTADGGTGLSAAGCAVPNPDPEIGGEDDQGSGPYLLTPAAAAQMRGGGLDPQDPCSSSFFVARELVKTARRVHADPESPEWKSHGDEQDQENARKYWSMVIETSGIFMDRSGAPGEACAVPPPDDPEEPWSISFKIISVWRCEATRIQDLYLVTDGEYEGEEFKYTIQEDRAAAIQTLVNEALSVSYGASKWKTEDCDNADEEEPQGIFPMTKDEAEEAEVTDRCDVESNIAGAAKMVLAVEKTPPKDRPDELGVFQPMIGGWEKLGIAMGTDLDLFALIGPGRNGYEATDECTQVMTQFLTDAAPHATEFAELTEPPSMETVYSEWRPKLDAVEEAHGLTNPSNDPACRIGSWAPGFNNTVAQIASGLAGDSPHSANLSGLSKYYQGREDANTETPPVVGEDTLVIPRLALRPLKPIGAPVAADAGQAWSQLGSNEGVTLPLSQVAVEYAWFFGGVIPPFNSAGKLIGSLENGGGGTSDGSGPVQVEVGPDGCPKEAPRNTLREGAAEIGINKLCVDSVAQARTPEAAKAIKWALTHLGWSYTMNTEPSKGPTRNDPEWADCSSFVSRAYRSAIPGLYSGNAPTTETLRTHSWTTKIPFSQLKPGDLVEPNSGHVAMQLANGYKVHTNTGSDVSRVERAYSSAFWSGWVNANNR
ncbi:hypothetical protein E1281_31185 [Actinomadura sp. KC345]|nr:hypothetical protein E1281_31185 [Actinomadura sp. KC345]